jgi:hypothetical protein
MFGSQNWSAMIVVKHVRRQWFFEFITIRVFFRRLFLFILLPFLGFILLFGGLLGFRFTCFGFLLGFFSGFDLMLGAFNNWFGLRMF